MDPQKRRDRMISFRLSENEYESLRARCVLGGVRNVSELAREALRFYMQEVLTEPKQSLEAKVDLLEGQMEELSRMVALLTNTGSDSN